MLELRAYQEKAIEDIYQWWDVNTGNPCVVMPTGSGKSVVIAAFCQRAIQDYPKTRILLCTHQKELIEQDLDKLLKIWPEADVGVYSASVGRKELDNQITFAGIQSIYKHANEVGYVDLILIDEAHLINSEDAGMYRSFISDLKAVNPCLKVIGFTATPYRLKHGLITDKPALFDKPLVEPVTITELQDMGYLCKLTSKATENKLETDNVGIVAGEYNQKDLMNAVDKPVKNEGVVKEVIRRGADRKAWLFFCSGVKHADHVKDILIANGISAACVTGSMSKTEREAILDGFKSGKYRALTNANVLTTGFDYPAIDLICMMRPTLSAGLYMQMAGRGLRISPSKENCLVLDFAGNVAMHGPVTEVLPPTRKRKGQTGVAPCKVCPSCGEIIPMHYKVCPVCLYEYPHPEEIDRKYMLSQLDINGTGGAHKEMEVKMWHWSVGNSRSGNKMITIRYYSRILTEEPINEFLLLWHESPFIRNKSIERLADIASRAGINLSELTLAEMVCDKMNKEANIPSLVIYHKQGKYRQVDNCLWK